MGDAASHAIHSLHQLATSKRQNVTGFNKENQSRLDNISAQPQRSDDKSGLERSSLLGRQGGQTAGRAKRGINGKMGKESPEKGKKRDKP